MRAMGLFALLLGTLAFLNPYYRLWWPTLAIDPDDARILGGVLVAGGAVALSLYARR